MIVYGSLWPWNFSHRALNSNVFLILLNSWDPAVNRYSVGDFLLNIAIYFPLGLLGYVEFRRKFPPFPAFLATLFLGTGLSVTIEIIQIFDRSRFCSLVDVLANATGTAAGALTSAVLAHVVTPKLKPFSRLFHAHLAAGTLLLNWVAYRTYPWLPSIGFHKIGAKLDAISRAPAFVLIPFLSAVIVWFVIGRLLTNMGVPRPLPWLVGSVSIIPAELIIFSRTPLLPELFGALAGVLLFILLGRRAFSSVLTAIALFSILLVRGLMPFHLQSKPNEFSWIPLGNVLGSFSWALFFGLVLEKSFYYGAAVWAVWKAGVPLRFAAAGIGFLLLIIELVQTHLPGRTPEITDPLIALVMALVFASVEGGAQEVPVRRRRLSRA